MFNTFMPVPAIMGCDGSWPLFHFWPHHLSPKLAFILKFYKSKRSCQCLNWHKNAQKLEWKTWSKIFLTTFGYSDLCDCGTMNFPYASPWCLLENAKLEASPEEGQQLQQKDNKKKKRERRWEKKIKVEKLKLSFDACPRKNVIKHDVSGQKLRHAVMMQMPLWGD